MWWTIAFLLLCSAKISRGSVGRNVKVFRSRIRRGSSCGIYNSHFGFPFIDQYDWYVCFVIFFLHFVQKLTEHPMPRSLPESKLLNLAQRTDYLSFYNDIFEKGVYRVRVPGSTGHHKVKMVGKYNGNTSVLLLANKLATSCNCLCESESHIYV